MAKKEDLDLDVEGGKKSSKLKLVLIITIVLVLLGAGGGAAWYFLLRPAPDMEVAQDADGAADAEEASKIKKKHHKRKADLGPPVYVELDPDFVVSFKDQRLARFMQLRVKLMSHDADLMEIVEQYKPVLRNNLLLLYSSQKFEDIVTREGKEKLLAQSLEEVNRTLEKEAGVDGIEAVYFTSFVAQ
jgi:flagellar FliL protein